MTVTRAPRPDDFVQQYDAEHRFDFFEDEQGDGLWAFGTIDPAEFARQASVYDIVSGWIKPGELQPYTAKDVRLVHVIIDTTGDMLYPRVLPEQSNISRLVAVIDR